MHASFICLSRLRIYNGRRGGGKGEREAMTHDCADSFGMEIIKVEVKLGYSASRLQDTQFCPAKIDLISMMTLHLIAVFNGHPDPVPPEIDITSVDLINEMKSTLNAANVCAAAERMQHHIPIRCSEAGGSRHGREKERERERESEAETFFRNMPLTKLSC